MTFAQILTEVFSAIIGIIFALVGIKALRDEGAQKKITTAAFWFVLAFTFICGYWLPKWITGACIVLMALLTGIKGVVQSKSDVPDHAEVRANADKIGYKIFIPALVIAIGSVILTWLGANIHHLALFHDYHALAGIYCHHRAIGNYIVLGAGIGAAPLTAGSLLPFHNEQISRYAVTINKFFPLVSQSTANGSHSCFNKAHRIYLP